MKVHIILVLAAIALTSCAHPPGIRPVGHDVFALSVPIASYGSIAGAEKVARIDAETHCRRMAKPMIFLSRDATAPGDMLEFVFRCPSKRFPGL